MSEPIPESIPTSSDPRSRRPVKKSRPTPSSNPNASAATTSQSSALSHLFSQIDKPVSIPTSSTKTKTLAPPPEIVANVQGSSAGAGSGEFHVYKAGRRREYERVRLMEEEALKEEANAEWIKKQKELKEKDDGKRSKNAKRREKAKARKGREKGEKDGGTVEDGEKGKVGPDAKGPGTVNGHDVVESVNVDNTNVDGNGDGYGSGLVIHDDG